MSRGAHKKTKWLLWSGLATVLVSPISSQAYAQVRGTVDISAQGVVGSSPFLDDGEENGAVSARLQISPSVFYEGDETTSGALRGNVGIDLYDGENGTPINLGLSGGIQQLISSRTTLSLNASVRSTRSTVRDFLLNPTIPRETSANFNPAAEDTGSVISPQFGPGELLDLDPDLTETGGRGRTNSYQLGGAVSHALSSLDSLSLGASVRFNNSDDPAASNYRSNSITGSYGRKLSNRTGLNAGVSVVWADYEGNSGPRRGNGTTIAPTVGISHRFSETLNANLNVGISITDVEGPNGESENNVGFAGSFSVCQLQYNGNLCGTASRGAQATAFGGITSVTSAAVSYSRSLSLRDSVNVTARYSHRGASLLPAQVGFDGSRSVFAASAGYDRKIAEQLFAFVSPSYAKTFGDVRSENRENYQISFGLRYRFGSTL
ncbi:hypothetical protein [Erythrobacter sp. QSSC1-22B]|uniref:hypothetical protein n=1 Tax=Erythrobacter sp. QSSC1-22B TaxID=1860125 RepID=UPI0011A62A7C|nr:hypothetical protein [Erythrobacter sp. QSSC1-22B]